MTEELKYTDWTKDLPPKGDKSRFAPKLTFDERCAWFALYHSFPDKVSVADIAEAAGISDPVASALVNKHHRRYQNVKREYKKLGLSAMNDKYVENRHIERIQAIKLGRSKALPRPGQIGLGTPHRQFIITQNERGKWTSFDIELDEVIHQAETRGECVDASIAFAATFRAA